MMEGVFFWLLFRWVFLAFLVFFCSGLWVATATTFSLSFFSSFVTLQFQRQNICLQQSSLGRGSYTKIRCSTGHVLLITPAPTTTIRLTLQPEQIWQHSSVVGLLRHTSATKSKTKRHKTGHTRGVDGSRLWPTVHTFPIFLSNGFDTT